MRASRHAAFYARIKDISREEHQPLTLGLITARPLDLVPTIAYVVDQLSELANADLTARPRFIGLTWGARRTRLRHVFLIDPVDVVEAQQWDGRCHDGGREGRQRSGVQ